MHRYKCHPLSEGRILSIEATIGDRLPEEYRLWLLRVGWGAGFDYGLLSPINLASENYFEEYHERDNSPDHSLLLNSLPMKASDPQDIQEVFNEEDLLIIAELGCGGYRSIITRGSYEGHMVEDISVYAWDRSPFILMHDHDKYQHGVDARKAGSFYGFLDHMEFWLNQVCPYDNKHG